VTLAKIMIVNAVVAAVLAATRIGSAQAATAATVLAACFGFFALGLMISTELEIVFGIRCPSCRRNTLKRLALPFQRIAYFQCTSCGLRCKREGLLSGWKEATEPQDAAKYRRKPRIGRWLGFEIPTGDDSTCGTLLRNKRRRAETNDSALAEGLEPRSTPCQSAEIVHHGTNAEVTDDYQARHS
jgi:hypothetical protein